MSKKIAICGATGVVGKELMKCLKNIDFPISQLSLFSSPRSAGKVLKTPYGEKTVQLFEIAEVQKHDFVFLCVSGDFSKKYAQILTEKGAIVIDNSSAFRYEDDIPLVVPEVNAREALKSKLIANPNCSTLILAVVLYPLYQHFGLKKTIVSTYQATSGAGYAAMQELKSETANYIEGKKVNHDKFVHPIPFNLIPHIDVFKENDYTKEEMKIVWETRKIFGNNSLQISCTAVRIPTFRAHAESVTLETEKKIDIAQVREILQNAPGVKLTDDIKNNIYPMPLTASNEFDVEVGRIRKNEIFGDFGLDFFVCGDQLLKGAAWNAVQIAQIFLK